MEIDEVITGIVVSYNTKGYLERAFKSVRNFHPKMKIIVIDGSDKKDPCYKYAIGLANEFTQTIHFRDNIGHGRGLCRAIDLVKTPYFLVFDSDIEMLKSPIQGMLEMMEDDTCGVGYIEKTAYDGHEFGCKSTHLNQGWIRYLHPYFCLIQLKEYRKYKPFIHHGAPAVNLSLDIHRRGLGNKVIKEFPGLGHSSGKGWTWTGEPREYVRHDTAGTREYRRLKGLNEIEGKWDPVISPNPVSTYFGGTTCITCTGDRPEAFDLCKRWMASQTEVVEQWIVVDDGKVPLPSELTLGTEYVRRVPNNNEGHTLLLNLKEAIPRIRGDRIIIIEDDDWYGPTYVQTMRKYLDCYDLVGECFARYYFLPTKKYRRIGNKLHASFSQTGFVRSLLPVLERNLEGDPYIDTRLWSAVKERKYLIVDSEDRLHLHCSMKGLKGRKGIGTGHNGLSEYYHDDIGLETLIRWVGDKNAQIYLDHIGQGLVFSSFIGSVGKNAQNALARLPIPIPPPVRAPHRNIRPLINNVGPNGKRIMPKNWR
jgi:hypothetical protein